MRAALTALLIALAGPAVAACPDFYRFVDFGIVAGDGTLVRGGPLFRAEDFDETPLLFTDGTVCTDVTDLAKDGRGNPIPVVTKIVYDRRTSDPALGWVEVAVSEDAFAMAERFAAVHNSRLADTGISQVRGETYLCAVASIVAFSCQIVSPYPNYAPVVVYCEDGECLSFAIAMTERLFISANWPMTVQSVEWQAEDVVSRVNAIADFLAPLSSSL
jgi:hypothetical protein